MCDEEQPVRVYVVDGPGGVHYIRQDGDIPTADVEAVLDGDLDALLLARLRRREAGRHG